MRLTRRYIIKSLDSIPLSSPLRYERYYINDTLRIQKKADNYEKEILNGTNEITEKIKITEQEFSELKEKAYSKIIRDSYLYLSDDRVSIKAYLADYEGLNRVEVKFSTNEEMENYEKEPWMGPEITQSPLAFDKYLSKLSKEEFLSELHKFI